MKTPTQTKKHSQRRRRRTVVLLSFFVVIAAVAGWYGYRHLQAAESQAQADSQFKTAEAVEGTVAVTIESPAVAEPYLTRTLRAPFGGLIEWIADEGLSVTEGDLLVRFDWSQLSREVALARVSLADAVVKRDRAAAELNSAERTLSAQAALLVSGAVSRDEVETLEDRAESAALGLRSAELAVEREQLRLEQAEAELEAAEIRAPFDGTVRKQEVAEGDRVGQNSTLLKFGDLSRLRFRAEIDEYDIGRIERGQSVSIRSDLLGDDHLRARIDRISPEAEIINNIPVFRVDATAENPEERLKPGMVVDLVVQLARDSGVVVPLTAVSSVRDRSYVEVVTEGGETEIRRVEIGTDDGRSIAILDGLDSGEHVKLPETAGVLPDIASEQAASSDEPEAIQMSVPGAQSGGGAGGGAGGGSAR